jgi:proteasome assembly chaperone (PAC2) family protein
MTKEVPLKNPWLVAVWPGMGQVAISAGFYLMSKLGMHGLAEYEANDLFDLDHVEVEGGLIKKMRRPRNRFYVWRDPKEKNDLIVFIGEAQPPLGRYPFCRKLIQFAQNHGVQRVFTFAAMASGMHPDDESRVFGAATNEANLGELRRLEIEILQEGNISGLNGVLLGVAAEANLPGVCLLGELPHYFAQLPYPKAALAVLNVFGSMSGLDVDLNELKEQAQAMDEHLRQVLEQLQKAAHSEMPEESEFEEAPYPEPRGNGQLSADDKVMLEKLFAQASEDRSKAFELKRELDRLNVFKLYEDRFLDLFKSKPN